MPTEVTLTDELREGLVLARVDTAERFGVDAWVTTRSGGFSTPPYDGLNLAVHVGDEPANVARNRAALARALGVGADELRFTSQVHGASVVSARDAPLKEADAIVTDDGEVLVIMVADCLPILLVDTASARLAVVHAGWRGLSGGIIARALERFDDPGRVYAFVGPGVEAERYQVGPEVAEHFAHIERAVRPDVSDRSRLDLAAVAAHELARAGLTDALIEVCAERTGDASRFFSDRRDRPTGRFALVARRRPGPKMSSPWATL